MGVWRSGEGARAIRGYRPKPGLASPKHCPGKRDALPQVGPAFREGQRRGAERPALALALPGTAGRLDAVADEARAERWHQHGTDAIGAVGLRPGLGVDQQRIAEVEPGEGKVFAPCGDFL